MHFNCHKNILITVELQLPDGPFTLTRTRSLVPMVLYSQIVLLFRALNTHAISEFTMCITETVLTKNAGMMIKFHVLFITANLKILVYLL